MICRSIYKVVDLFLRSILKIYLVVLFKFLIFKEKNYKNYCTKKIFCKNTSKSLLFTTQSFKIFNKPGRNFDTGDSEGRHGICVHQVQQPVRSIDHQQELKHYHDNRIHAQTVQSSLACL